MRIIGTFGLGLLVLAALVIPANADGPRIAQIKTVKGAVTIVRGSERLPAKLGDPLYESDVVETGADSSVGLTFIDNTVFSAGPDSQVALAKFHFAPDDAAHDALEADVRHGTLNVVSGDITHAAPGSMKIKTPTAILGVAGTTFAVKVY